MIGRVDEEGRALVTIRMAAAKNSLVHEVDVWVDTGFNGDLVLPKVYIEELKLPHAGTAKAVLADGSEVSLKVHLCLIEWFGEIRELNVVATSGQPTLARLAGVLRYSRTSSCIRSISAMNPLADKR